MYYIDKENYRACEDYLLSYEPDGFAAYKTADDVRKMVEELLESFTRRPDIAFVACGGIMLTCIEEDYFELYVKPEYRYREVKDYYKGTMKSPATFELV